MRKAKDMEEFLLLQSASVVSLPRPYYRKVLSYGPIAYWPLWEATGTTARCLVDTAQNGVYTGVTLMDAPGPDGSPCPYFDGANDYVNVLSTALAASFDFDELTIAVWCRVNGVAVWADGTSRRALHLLGTNNAWAMIRKEVAANTVGSFWRGDDAVGRVITQGGVTTTGWFHLALTATDSQDEIRFFYNGIQAGATLNGVSAATGVLGIAIIGAGSAVPVDVWHGWLSHAAVFNRALTPAQIADLAVV